MSTSAVSLRLLLLLIALFELFLGAVSKAAAANVNHVIHISVDGLRGDFLEMRVNTFPLLYPNFKRFVDQGATTFNARTDFTHTNTIPNHTSMLTGRPVLQPGGLPNTTHHGYTRNSNPVPPTETLHNNGNPNLSYVPGAFDVVHDNGLSTALYASKSKFVIYEQSYSAITGALDTTGDDNGRDKIDTFVLKSTGSPVNAANLHADYLADMATSEYNYTFLHYRDPDTAGHSFGWGSATWDTSVQNVDGYLGDIFNLVETDAGLANDTVIIITADHGGLNFGHSIPADLPAHYTVPVFVWGPGVAPSADLYALNPTSRLDPGTGRPDYTAAIQPIRNVDTGNLALDLLGLGAIAGSLSNATQDLAIGSAFTADFDGNQAVNSADLGIWETAFGRSTGASIAQGDADIDGDVDGADFLVWQQQHGSSLGFLAASTTVPEPATVVLGLIAALCYTTSRSAKSSSVTRPITMGSRNLHPIGKDQAVL